MTEKMLLRASELVDALGVSRAKVYEMIASGELPSVRIGRSVRVPAASLERWIEVRLQTSSDERGTEK